MPKQALIAQPTRCECNLSHKLISIILFFRPMSIVLHKTSKNTINTEITGKYAQLPLWNSTNFDKNKCKCLQSLYKSKTIA